MKLYYERMEDVPENYRQHLDQMHWADGRVPTDAEKLEAFNNLSAVLENIMDMWHGTGTYNRPNYDAAEFRRKEIERHAKEDKMTPQKFYDEAYVDFMNRYGKLNIKQHGVEATEEKARAWATSSMERALESREQWQRLQARREQKKEKPPAPKRKRGKSSTTA